MSYNCQSLHTHSCAQQWLNMYIVLWTLISIQTFTVAQELQSCSYETWRIFGRYYQIMTKQTSLGLYSSTVRHYQHCCLSKPHRLHAVIFVRFVTYVLQRDTRTWSETQNDCYESKALGSQGKRHSPKTENLADWLLCTARYTCKKFEPFIKGPLKYAVHLMEGDPHQDCHRASVHQRGKLFRCRCKLPWRSWPQSSRSNHQPHIRSIDFGGI